MGPAPADWLLVLCSSAALLRVCEDREGLASTGWVHHRASKSIEVALSVL